MDWKEFRIQLSEEEKRIARIASEELPTYMGVKGVSLFKRNFLTQSFFGEKWKEVKRRTHPGKSAKAQRNAMRQILVGRTGNLRSSIRYKVGDGYVDFYSDAEYGAVHNQGLPSGRGGGFTMPKRQFIGHHKEVDKVIRKAIEQFLKRRK